MKEAELINEVEKLVDASDLESVLFALEDVCHLKADHLRSNWQDETSAKFWVNAAKHIQKANQKI